MLRGFLGKKIGMSQVFRENGESVPVTVIQAGPCAVTQIKSRDTDGYESVQLGFGSIKRPLQFNSFSNLNDMDSVIPLKAPTSK